MHLPAVGDPGERKVNSQPEPSHGQLLWANTARSLCTHGQRNVRVGLEVVSVENPSAIGNGDTELMLLVALTPQRKEATIVRCARTFKGPPT